MTSLPLQTPLQAFLKPYQVKSSTKTNTEYNSSTLDGEFKYVVPMNKWTTFWEKVTLQWKEGKASTQLSVRLPRDCGSIMKLYQRVTLIHESEQPMDVLEESKVESIISTLLKHYGEMLGDLQISNEIAKNRVFVRRSPRQHCPIELHSVSQVLTLGKRQRQTRATEAKKKQQVIQSQSHELSSQCIENMEELVVLPKAQKRIKKPTVPLLRQQFVIEFFWSGILLTKQDVLEFSKYAQSILAARISEVQIVVDTKLFTDPHGAIALDLQLFPCFLCVEEDPSMTKKRKRNKCPVCGGSEVTKETYHSVILGRYDGGSFQFVDEKERAWEIEPVRRDKIFLDHIIWPEHVMEQKEYEEDMALHEAVQQDVLEEASKIGSLSSNKKEKKTLVHEVEFLQEHYNDANVRKAFKEEMGVEDDVSSLDIKKDGLFFEIVAHLIHRYEYYPNTRPYRNLHVTGIKHVSKSLGPKDNQEGKKKAKVKYHIWFINVRDSKEKTPETSAAYKCGHLGQAHPIYFMIDNNGILYQRCFSTSTTSEEKEPCHKVFRVPYGNRERYVLEKQVVDVMKSKQTKKKMDILLQAKDQLICDDYARKYTQEFRQKEKEDNARNRLLNEALAKAVTVSKTKGTSSSNTLPISDVYKQMASIRCGMQRRKLMEREEQEEQVNQ